MKGVIPSHIEGYDEGRKWLESIGNAGFILILNHTRKGTECLDSTYPVEWQEEYEDKGYTWRDPVLLGSFTDGDRRWSDILIPDIMGVMRRARRFGLNYGGSFTRSVGRNKSLLCVSRHDRELTDDEMWQISEWWTDFTERGAPELRITSRELAAYECLINGMDIESGATHLGISVPAFKSRLKSARDRMGVENNYQAIARIFRNKLLQ